MKTPHQRRDGARPAVSPDDDSRPIDGPDAWSDSPPRTPTAHSADGFPATDLSPRQKRLASKAAYRARRSTNNAFREGSASELGNGGSSTVTRRANKSERRVRSIITGHSLRSTAKDKIIPMTTSSMTACATRNTRPISGAQPPTMPSRLTGSRRPNPTASISCPLNAVEILDWLLSLPDKFGPAVFVMFSVRLRHHTNPQTPPL